MIKLMRFLNSNVNNVVALLRLIYVCLMILEATNLGHINKLNNLNRFIPNFVTEKRVCLREEYTRLFKRTTDVFSYPIPINYS